MNAKILLLVLSLFAFNALAADPQVELKTSVGVIVVELNPEKAPKSVENFLQYVKDGHYKGTIFHRVIPGFMVQGGGFSADFMQKKTRAPIPIEANNGLKNDVGTIAMARTSDPNSATAQFFINHKNNDFLNHSAPTPQGWGYAVFGKVVKGMDVVNKIAAIPTGPRGPFPSDVPSQQVIIEDARILGADKPAAK
ncbi:MAG: peptidyl-prolyl cis-trans isomerase [Betaproteobacteria bacterium]|nr:peptidyl-prolyl cis-trans isomerase [Betaproteobacteria bacterium]